MTKKILKEPANRSPNQNGRLYVVERLRAGKKPSDIVKEGKIKERTLWRFMREFKQTGVVKKLGYGVWQVVKQPANLGVGGLESFKKTPQIRGHAFTWELQLPKIANWHKRPEQLRRKKVNFKTYNKNQWFVFKEKKVQLCNKKIIIYDPEGKSYFGISAEQSEQLAFYNLNQYLISLQRLLGIELGRKLVIRVPYPHYSRVKDSLAIQCNKKKEKVIVKIDQNNQFVIDNSFQLNEAETQGSNAKYNMDNVYSRSIKEMFENNKTPKDMVENAREEFSNSLNEFKPMIEALTEQIALHLEVQMETKNTLELQQRVQDSTLSTLKELKEEIKKGNKKNRIIEKLAQTRLREY